jgi:hypothetical protein
MVLVCTRYYNVAPLLCSVSHECALLAATPRTAPSFGGVNAHNLCKQLERSRNTHFHHFEKIMRVVPRLTDRKGAAVSLVQDQDINIEDAEKADLTITVIGPAEHDSVKHVTDVLVSNSVCSKSRYLQPIIDTSTIRLRSRSAASSSARPLTSTVKMKVRIERAYLSFSLICTV